MVVFVCLVFLIFVNTLKPRNVAKVVVILVCIVIRNVIHDVVHGGEFTAIREPLTSVVVVVSERP